MLDSLCSALDRQTSHIASLEERVSIFGYFLVSCLDLYLRAHIDELTVIPVPILESAQSPIILIAKLLGCPS